VIFVSKKEKTRFKNITGQSIILSERRAKQIGCRYKIEAFRSSTSKHIIFFKH